MNASLLSFPAGQVIEDRKAVGTSLEQVYAQFAYTPNGKQLWVKDAKANQTTYLYGAFDRMLTHLTPQPRSAPDLLPNPLKK